MRFFVQIIEAHEYFYDDPKMCPFSFFFTVQHGVNIVLCILILIYDVIIQYSGVRVVLRDVNSSNIILTRSVRLSIMYHTRRNSATAILLRRK